MIRAEFQFGENGLGVTVQGHSGSAAAGEDIVCAAVSSAVYMAANTVTEVLGLSPKLNVRDGFLSLFLSDSTEAETARPVLQGLYLHLTGLQEQFPDFIQIERGAF